MIKAGMSPMGALALSPTFLSTVRPQHGLRRQLDLKRIRRRSTIPRRNLSITRITIAARLPIARAIPKRRTFIPTIAGSGMIQAAMTSTSVVITPGSMDASPVVSGRVISSGLKAEGLAGSGLAGSFSTWLITMLPIATTGSGTAMTSWFMKTLTMLGGIWLTTHGSVPTCMWSFSDVTSALVK